MDPYLEGPPCAVQHLKKPFLSCSICLTLDCESFFPALMDMEGPIL